MSDLLPLAHLTDEELLGRVYLTGRLTDLEQELATRLTHALDELRKPPKSPEDFEDLN